MANQPATPASGERSRPGKADTDGRQLFGRVLLDAGIVSEGELETALDAAHRWDVPVGQAVLSLGMARPVDFYPALAQHLGLPYVNLLDDPPPDYLFDASLLDFYLAAQAVPVRREYDQRLVLASPDPLAAAREIALRRAQGLSTPAGHVAFVVTPRLDVLWTLQERFDTEIQYAARFDLDEHEPHLSARRRLPRSQMVWLGGLALFGVIAAVAAPIVTLAVVSFVLGLFFLAVLGLRAISIPLGIAARQDQWHAPDLPDDASLPVYTVLVPLYREAEVLPLLAKALRALDYPAAKLDIKLILEGDDQATLDAAKALDLEAHVEFIRVPDGPPRTKPKACNYALQFARGDYLVIFDAEDQPDPMQLKKAVAAFGEADEGIACLQAPLTYFNANENWLTRQFTIEFNMWFDLLLPTVDRLGMPIPLGGTSTHFRMAALREVGAWDPYNVTEDADLGIRLAQKGYRCGILDSVTYEEANCELGNWLRQRSRWLKGYAQTWLVHMRRPGDLLHELGPFGFLGFQLLIGGSIVSALAHPFVWAIAAAGLAVSGSPLAYFTGPEIPYLLIAFNMTLLGGGYIVSVCAGIAAVQQRGAQHLVPHVFLMVFYWPLQSAAAYMAVFQFVTRPHYWEKTRHAISRASRAQLAQLARRDRHETD